MRNGSWKWSNEITSSFEILMMRQSQIGDCISNREFELIQSDSQLKVESFTNKVWIWIVSNLLSTENIWIFSTKIDSAFSKWFEMIRIIYRFVPNPASFVNLDCDCIRLIFMETLWAHIAEEFPASRINKLKCEVAKIM